MRNFIEKTIRFHFFAPPLLIVLSCLVFLFLNTEGQAADAETTNSVLNSRIQRELDDVDRDIYIELIRLSRFNVKFHLEANYHQKWRVLTYALGREAGTAVSFGGTVTDIYQQGKNLNHPRGISRNAVKDSIACGITGSALSGTASSLELAQNAWVMWQAKKKGYSPEDSIQYIRARNNNIDKLLEERDGMTESMSDEVQRKIRKLETALMKQIRQQLICEFATWSCHSRDQAWQENTFYTIDALQSFTLLTAIKKRGNAAM